MTLDVNGQSHELSYAAVSKAIVQVELNRPASAADRITGEEA